MSLRWDRTIEIRSVVGAAGVSSELLSVAGARVTVQVLTAPAALVSVRGSLGNNPAFAVNLTMFSAAGGGYVAATGLGAGFYSIVDRPNYLEIFIAQDAGGPRTFRVAVATDPEE